MKDRLSQLVLVPIYAFALVTPVSQGVANICVAGIAGAAVLSLFLSDPPRRLPIARSILIALAAYFAVHALATALSDPYTVRWNKWAGEMWLKSLLVLVPVVLAGRTGHAARAMKIMIVVGAVVAIYGVAQHFTGVDLWRGGTTGRAGALYQAVGFFGHHLSYGGHVMLLWIAAAAWGLLGAIDARRRGLKSLPWIALVLLSLGLLWSFARSAQLGAAAGAVVLAWSLPGRRRWAAFAALAALGASMLAVPSVAQRFAELGDVNSEITRVNLWKSSWAGIVDRPLLGYGLGNFHEMMEVHEIDGFYDVRGHSHNDFIMHGVNAGILGLMTALALLVTTTSVLWRGRRGLGSRAWLPVAGAACQIGISVAGLFQVYQTDNEVEMVLYFVLGCGLATLAEKRPLRTSPPLAESVPLAHPTGD